MIQQDVLFLIITIVVCASGISALYFIKNDNPSDNPITNFITFLFMMALFVICYGFISVVLSYFANQIL